MARAQSGQSRRLRSTSGAMQASLVWLTRKNICNTVPSHEREQELHHPLAVSGVEGAEGLVQHAYEEYAAAWSPYGEYVAAVSWKTASARSSRQPLAVGGHHLESLHELGAAGGAASSAGLHPLARRIGVAARVASIGEVLRLTRPAGR